MNCQFLFIGYCQLYFIIYNLTRYKKKYIELSRKKGYPYNQIGKNINISAAAARKIFTKTQ